MRGWCGPHQIGYGRRFCEEFCTDICQAADPATCFELTPPEPLEANVEAWHLWKQAFWQWQSSGMGDATLNADYVLAYLGDRGFAGPDRAEMMDRFRVLSETFSEMQRIEAKAKEKKNQQADEAPTRN